MPDEQKKLYWIWAAMIQRCENPNNKGYKYYGGKGISVCKEWRESFDAFYFDMGLKPEGKSLDRRDPSKGYSKGNCYWASSTEQNNNRPGFCIYVDIDGQTQSVKQAWRRYSPPGLSYRAVMKRIHRGWSAERALLIRAANAG